MATANQTLAQEAASAVQDVELQVALTQFNRTSWVYHKRWYNSATLQWYYYQYYKELKVLVIHPEGHDYMTTAVECHPGTLVATINYLFETRFDEHYPDLEDE